MVLKPQDILFLPKLVALDKKPWSFSKLAIDLGMSPSEVHAAAKRTQAARLAIKEGGNIWPNIRNFEEFMLYGIQYVFIPEWGELNRGMPTANRQVNPHGIAPYFLITKLETFDGRGGGDYQMSHDMEDIIVVLDGRPEIFDEVKRSKPELTRELSVRFKGLLEDGRFVDAIAGHMPPDETSQARVSIILKLRPRLT